MLKLENQTVEDINPEEVTVEKRQKTKSTKRMKIETLLVNVLYRGACMGIIMGVKMFEDDLLSWMLSR